MLFVKMILKIIKKNYIVTHRIVAGQNDSPKLKKGEVARIFTGA